MRRLPIYLVLDTSGSMRGEPIKAVNEGIQMLVSALRQDPYALETAYLSVISFESYAEQVIPLTELVAFQLPSLKAGGYTALGDALALLTDCIEREVIKTTAAVKGDWKPLVFLMTDGRPGDAWKRKLERLKQAKIGIIVACAAGQAANLAILKQITEHVVRLETTDSNTIKAFFKWVSASVSAGSQKVDSGQKEVVGLSDLPPPPPGVSVVG